MNTINHSFTYFQYGSSNFSARAIVLALVVSAHFAVLGVWQSRDSFQVAATNQLSVTFNMAVQAPQPSKPQPQKTEVVPLPEPAQVAEPETTTVVEQKTAAAPTETAITDSVVADAAPDYKAAYLNNTPPGYPMIARRNGLQGRVMLNVEVLANGLCGQINIQKSSGYTILDNAALQTVKNWRFVPARHAGITIDKWFMIPIQFSLKD